MDTDEAEPGKQCSVISLTKTGLGCIVQVGRILLGGQDSLFTGQVTRSSILWFEMLQAALPDTLHPVVDLLLPLYFRQVMVKDGGQLLAKSIGVFQLWGMWNRLRSTRRSSIVSSQVFLHRAHMLPSILDMLRRRRSAA